MNSKITAVTVLLSALLLSACGSTAAQSTAPASVKPSQSAVATTTPTQAPVTTQASTAAPSDDPTAKLDASIAAITTCPNAQMTQMVFQKLDQDPNLVGTKKVAVELAISKLTDRKTQLGCK